MSRTALLGTFVFVVAALSGCASPAKLIKSDMTTAVIAVPEDTNTWPFYYRDAAQAAAAEKITEPFWVATNRVKVGETTTSMQDQTRHDLGGSARPNGEVTTSTNRTSTSDTYEYHLVFQSRRPRQLSYNTRPGDQPQAPGGSPLITNATLPPTPGGSPLTSNNSLLPAPAPSGLPLNPSSSLPPSPPVLPASGSSRYELPPASDIKVPPPSPLNLPSTAIPGPGR